MTHSPVLAVDFGTSNSAAALLREGQITRIEVEAGEATLPTAVFFPADGSAMQIGTQAAQSLIAGEEGRYMRALKSILGVPLLHETRLLGGKRRTVAEVITAFLTTLRDRAEAQAGHPVTHALSGRPVRFHSDDSERDAQAEADLRGCYLAAGFTEVDFLPEPEAAAISCQGMGAPEGLGLIVDIGGGTSDFSVFRNGARGPEILASHGIRLGGTDFDHAVSMAHAMPVLGLGGQLRRTMGAGLLPVPRAPYVELSTWAKIPFLYTQDTRRMVADMVRHAVDRPAMERFAEVLELELGHELAFAVERGKIAANNGAEAAAIDMGALERGLRISLSETDLDRDLAPTRSALRDAMDETLQRADVEGRQIARIILVGGSSLMGFIAAEAQAICPEAKVLRSNAFTAVVDGLALATA
ncbi:Hsp70 family protein [Gymnodinialimonas ceratoperidinii]|uniref:Hsp70 family protein n=1 Tax=Gymnodinialimonas ceratoperidinii TaxID=2856823 RepID=A0A8F6TV58_9RHOB|nr:Hsp70 family protein [Gymnodinialimonas ceratoperidinii]QXT39551.1 Hsp70 family protein [Gymnodinialimonas ceratoperidinii]